MDRMTARCETHSWENDDAPVIQGSQTTQIQKCWRCGCVRARVSYGLEEDTPRVPKFRDYGWKVAVGMVCGTLLVAAAAVIFIATATAHILPASFTTGYSEANQTKRE